MKGPYERLKYDLRRVWECPVCMHHERSTGAETTLLCRCQANVHPTKQVWMKLIEDGPRQVLSNGKIFVSPPEPNPIPAAPPEETPDPQMFQ